MSELKVGDKLIDSTKGIHTLVWIGEAMAMLEDCKGIEIAYGVGVIKQYFKPYQEPVPVKRIVAFECDDGLVDFAIEGSKDCKVIEENADWKRIEISPEMFGWAK